MLVEQVGDGPGRLRLGGVLRFGSATAIGIGQDAEKEEPGTAARLSPVVGDPEVDHEGGQGYQELKQIEWLSELFGVT